MRSDDMVLTALRRRFGDGAFRSASSPGPVAVFPACHPDVGEARIWAPRETGRMDLRVQVGDVLSDSLANFDTHLTAHQRVDRLIEDLLRLLDHLFTDRLVFWRSAHHGRGGWREKAELTPPEPLVMDNCAYQVYLWSRPLGLWRGSDAIVGHGAVRDDRDYQILLAGLAAESPCGIDERERERVEALVADYERDQGIEPGNRG